MKFLTLLFITFFSSVAVFAQGAGIPLEAVEVPVMPDASLFVKILAWVVAVNLILGGIAAALGKVKDMTATQADNKAYEWISKITGLLQKVVDFAAANTRPKSDKK